MTVIGKSSTALFFNGVSDGIVVPQAPFNKTGLKTTHGNAYDSSVGQSQQSNSRFGIGKVTKSFTIEAWVVPDCGGVIAMKEGVFELHIGTVGTPGPAQFIVHTQDPELGSQTVSVSSASPNISSAAHNGWDGIVYPTDPNVAIHGTHNQFNSSLGLESALNKNVRDLIHIVGIFTGEQVKLYVNAELIASQKVNKKVTLSQSASDLYLGGRGGEFRGTIEGVHWRRGYNESGIRAGPLLVSGDTIGLWRFEEPVEIPTLDLNLKVNASANANYWYISSEQGYKLHEYITGKITTADTSMDFHTDETYSNGVYKTPYGDIHHVPINLIINPTGVDEKTGKAYQTSPPERVRLSGYDLYANGSNARLKIYSIHLNYDGAGLQNSLHAHAGYDTTHNKSLGSSIAIINSDLLIDSGTGKPLRAPGMSTQVVDRTGQMVVDEANGNHGFMFNQQIATDTTNNPFAFNWAASGLPEGFQAGHTGRHRYTQIIGHPFLRTLPPSMEEHVSRNLDGQSDSFMAYFDGASVGMRDQIPIGTILDMHRQAFIGSALSVETTSTATQVAENGMAGVDLDQRSIIAIGGAGFSPQPFLLKGHASANEDGTFDTYNLHLTPEDTDRVAILEVPSLSGSGVDMAPYVEIHYNAIDLTGATIGYSASGTTTGAMTSTNTKVNLKPNAAKAFGVDSSTFDAYDLMVNGVRGAAAASTATVTISYSANTLTLSAAYAAFTTAHTATGGQIVHRTLKGPALCVTKTVPACDVVPNPSATGLQIIDHIQTALASGATLHSPGGVIRISDDDLGTGSVAFKPHRLVGDNTGGSAYELSLNTSKTPVNYMPQNPIDSPQKPPMGITASHVTNPSHASQYHKLIIRPSQSGTSGSASAQTKDPPVESAPDAFVMSPTEEAANNNNGVFDRPPTNHRSNLYEMFDIIDNWSINKTHCIVMQPTMKSRTMQLSKFVGKDINPKDHNFISVEFMQTRGRLTEFREGKTSSGRTLVLKGVGLLDDIRNTDTDFVGDGSPDSHPIKEITPGGPVVSVSFGGVGQGGKDTKPTYDPSPIARIGWNTRRPAGAMVNVIDNSGNPNKVTVKPMNNKSAALASWGHICFPPSSGDAANPTARFYLPNGASAAYFDIVSGEFRIPPTDTGRKGKWFIDSNGNTHETFVLWVAANSLQNGSAIFVDPYIGDDTQCDDGTTVQDRMFQKLGTVQHDYQLGTQYASTRALAEIPLFPDQFFENQSLGIFPGPNNSMKITLDATMTAHTWAPNPVSMRPFAGLKASDPTVVGPYHYAYSNNTYVQGTTITGSTIKTKAGSFVVYNGGPTSAHRLHVDNIAIFPDARGTYSGYPRGVPGTFGCRKAILDNGEWCYYMGIDGDALVIQSGVGYASKDFIASIEAGTGIRPMGTIPFNPDIQVIGDGEGYTTAEAQEFRSPSYFDRSNVQTQGGNIDYGLRQYVSAVEFKAGPETNPHLLKARNSVWKGTIELLVGGGASPVGIITDNRGTYPRHGATGVWHASARVKAINRRNNVEFQLLAAELNAATMTAANIDDEQKGYVQVASLWSNGNIPTVGASANIHTGDELEIIGIGIPPHLHSALSYTGPDLFPGAILNNEWMHPYAQGGLREGDTVWMNMHYTNPHATDGLFCKSRGTFNNLEVHKMFNGGGGSFGFRSRESIPIENFLIGNNCRETADNFAQHVNQTIIHNVTHIGDLAPDGGEFRTVAFVDPYLSTSDHARVLLYDVKHDREFISFHDIYMQVQTDADALAIENMDVANGKSSQIYDQGNNDLGAQVGIKDGGYSANTNPKRPKVRQQTDRSSFIEGAYSHIDRATLMGDRVDAVDESANAMGAWMLSNNYNKNYMQGAVVNSQTGLPIRTNESSCYAEAAQFWFVQGLYSQTKEVAHTMKNLGKYKSYSSDYASATGNAATALRFSQTTMDTPDGTRAIPAFLCLKGIRTAPIKPRYGEIKMMPQWTEMEFTRRLTIDMGEVGIKEGITSIQAAAEEVVRLINQAGAPKGRSNVRRPMDQYAGPDIDQKDPSSKHIKADFAVTGSTHDPAAFWDNESKVSFDRGSHMGYLRAHIGRVVEDASGNEGFTIVVHSTVPGATGRNFCVWLDNSRGQSIYNPKFLIGHGGRFRDFYCQPEEMWGECMHPAPMPINKHGRPFAPITTLHELVADSKPAKGTDVNSRKLPPTQFTTGGEGATPNHGQGGGGFSSNTVHTESSTPNQQSVIQGLRVGTNAIGRINFGGLTASGIPGWTPDLGTWGFGESGQDNRAHSIYQQLPALTETTPHVPMSEKYDVGDGELYAFEFQDHLGKTYRIRVIYKQYGEVFANNQTNIPATLENEIVIWVDDRDVGQGGFTIGKHMKGAGDIGGRIKSAEEWLNKAGANSAHAGVAADINLGSISNEQYCGNRWNTVKAHQAAWAVSLVKPTATTGDLVLASGTTANSFGRLNLGIWHDIPLTGDALGHMGFPKTNGVIQISHGVTATKHLISKSGTYVSYTHRTTMPVAGDAYGTKHTFYGCINIPTDLTGWSTAQIGPLANNDPLAPVCISARPNWTCLLTDEVLAAAVEHAINLEDPNSDNIDETSFDCTTMYASDGRTLGEWGVAPTAIRVQAYNQENNVPSLSKLFSVNRETDWGMLDAHIVGHADMVPSTHKNLAQAGTLNYIDPQNMLATRADAAALAAGNGIFNSVIDAGISVPCGYIPRTVLHISTKYVGSNSNTATPRLVNSRNNPVDTTAWEQNLRGVTYRYTPGDTISPQGSNPTINAISMTDGTVSLRKWTIGFQNTAIGTGHGLAQLFQFGPIGRCKGELNQVAANQRMFFNGSVQGEDASYVEAHTIWSNNGDWAKVVPFAYNYTDGQAAFTVVPASGLYGKQYHHAFSRLPDSSHAVVSTSITNSESFKDAKGWSTMGTNFLIQKWPNKPELEGIRYAASNFGAKPFIYFRGGKNSDDHSVPLYFGGGFSGAVIDINDGTQNDYTEFYTHPYSAGPTGTAGIQNANEIMGSHALLDTTAILAMFPGTGHLDQHKGQVVSPLHNQDLVLPYDMEGGTGQNHIPTTSDAALYQGGGSAATKVHQTQPSPVILRFAHTHARHRDATPDSGSLLDSENQTTFVIFGPGQSIPHYFGPEKSNGSIAVMQEPSVAVSLSALWSSVMDGSAIGASLGPPFAGGGGGAVAVPGYPSGLMSAQKMCYMGTPAYAYLPNDPSTGTLATWVTPHTTQTIHGRPPPDPAFMPPPQGYQAGNAANWNMIDNWESAQGDPHFYAYNQMAYYGKNLSDHFLRNDWRGQINPARSLPNTSPSGYGIQLWSIGSTGYAHPYTPLVQSVVDNPSDYSAGIASDISGPANDITGSVAHTTAKLSDISGHMDGGYLPGGNFMDDRVVRNPSNFGVYAYPWMEAVVLGYNPSPVRVGDNAAMYRIAAPMLVTNKQEGQGANGYITQMQQSHDNWVSATRGNVDRDVIVIDATRVQNAEELATVISCAINEWPGTGALKALGGTFLPTFQHAHKQDKYAWAEMPIDRTADAPNSKNHRVDHLDYHYDSYKNGIGVRSNWGLGVTLQSMSVSIADDGGTPYYMPKGLPAVGTGRILAPESHAQSYLSVASSGSTSGGTIAATKETPTQYVVGNQGLYFFYRGMSAANDTENHAEGANRSVYLAANYRTGLRVLESPVLDAAKRVVYIGGTAQTYWTTPGSNFMDCAVLKLIPPDAPEMSFGMYIHTKTGNHRWDNGAIANMFSQTAVTQNASRYKLSDWTSKYEDTSAATHVHFNGLHDAVDRTRPIGAVGWAGNQYSMLNSVGSWIETADGGQRAYGMSRGLGAWHPSLGFNPYGKSMGCHGSNHTGAYSSQYAMRGNTGQVMTDANDGSTEFTAAVADVKGLASGHETYEGGWSSTYNRPKGISERHYVVVSHESELALVARTDQLKIVGVGDRLSGIWMARDAVSAGPPQLASPEQAPPFFSIGKGMTSSPKAATTWWNEGIHNADRFTAPANGGPYVEAQVFASMPIGGKNDGSSATKNTTVAIMKQADSCAAETGDLFLSKTWQGSAPKQHEAITAMHGDRGGVGPEQMPTVHYQDVLPNNWWQGGEGKSPALNFTTDHIVWKRMDGGNLSLPAPNARGMGAVPWVYRSTGLPNGTSTVIKTGETLYGNCRFSFETTNSAMLPVMQSQELAHPSLAEKYPHEIGDVLTIPNEEIQFQSITVIDDTGQEHTIEGGSPFGTIIRDFNPVTNRPDIGMAPSLSGSGNQPNMDIQLPDPDTIPGNLIIRSGFDRIQSYQNETIGTGGMMHPGQGQAQASLGQSIQDGATNTFNGWQTMTPNLFPYWENYMWEHIGTENNDMVNQTLFNRFGQFPEMSNDFNEWMKATGNAPLQTSYEPHDRTLYFHIVKNGASYSKRETVLQGDYSPIHSYVGRSREIAGGSGAGSLLTPAFIAESMTVGTITSNTIVFGSSAVGQKGIWMEDGEGLRDDSNRRFATAYNPTTKKWCICSYTGFSGGSLTWAFTTLTGVVYGPGWDATMVGQAINPSFYTPAGTTRMYAARRMRDHAEISGSSPDMPLIEWWKMNRTDDPNLRKLNPWELITAPRLTAMPIPRMGHHFVTPTMAMLPGHMAHPAYQNIYGGHTACDSVRPSSDMSNTGNPGWVAPAMDPNIWFSNLTPNYPPSDIHGGAFTLMTETKIRFDGYGILASNGVSGEYNRKGQNMIVLEAASHYTQTSHFPDPLEVGAYQIVIQPNIHSQNITGFHQNTALGNVARPANAGAAELNLTGQQIATVVSLIHDWGVLGATALVLADPVIADVRGCEIYLNEIMLDIDPAPGQQFTSLPPLATFNPLGVNETSSPAFSRRSMPYNTNMFKRATPAYTLTIPWWAIPSSTTAWSELSLFNVNDYYLFCRSTFGAISAQITLAGYPSHYFQPYTHELESMNPVTQMTAINSGGSILDVADNLFFPQASTTYGQVLITYDGNGLKQTATYSGKGRRGDNSRDTTRFTGVTATTPGFWTALTVGAPTQGTGKIYLSGAHQNSMHGGVLTDPEISPLPRILPQLLNGSRDTNNLFLADAFLCMYHPNLGRPFTAYSEGRSTVIPNGASTSSHKSYNILPESFEMVHYHEFAYAISSGPFALGMKWMDRGSTTNALVDPDAASPAAPYVSSTIGSKKYFFGSFWPGGSRYGAASSRLDMWGDIERGWNAGDVFAGDCKTYTINHGIADPMLMRVDQDVAGTWTGFTDTSGLVPWARNQCFGYRFSIRQPYNRPRWATAIKSVTDKQASFHANTGHYGYFNGPYIQADNGLDYQLNGSLVTATGAAVKHNYTGIIERQTNASNMLGFDFPGWQVRYSDGRRITKSFGCPIRTLRNRPQARRLFPRDAAGMNINDVAIANMYYVVDWWGNTTGEDVRRFPVRGFGVRPSFDPEAWKWTDAVAVTPPALYTTDTTRAPSVQEGNTNTVNNNAYVSNTIQTDFFNPLDSTRVGDRGDGRGARYPVPFNEFILQSMDTVSNPIGMMLSFHTAEPPFTLGLLRPRNDTLASNESKRGISSRLGISSADGLLKPEAMSGRNIESSTGVFGMAGLTFQDPSSRISPRIGLDSMTVAESQDSDPRNYIIQATQAVSLHTDRVVGQRYIFEGAYAKSSFPVAGSSVGTLTLDNLDFSKPKNATWDTITSIMRFNNAHGMSPMGGNYILEVSSPTKPFDDAGWGVTSAAAAYVLSNDGPTSNPYQANTVAGLIDPIMKTTNTEDNTVRFVVRPYRALDYRHVSLFRTPITVSGPQHSSQKPFFESTAGGRYGLFNYDMPKSRASTSGIYVSTSIPSPTNTPYAASYIPDQSTFATFKSWGPKIYGASVLTSDRLQNHVARLIITENTLQHYRSDASRRQAEVSEDDEESEDVVVRPDFKVQPRYSQALHPKGQDDKTSTGFNTGTHDDDNNANYTGLRSNDG
tara:strand:- start:6253 stop:23988 length:17736 start_codon:yes stop_codon:yes gene_type:complete